MLISGAVGSMVDNLRESFGRTSEYFAKGSCRIVYFLCNERGIKSVFQKALGG